MSAQRTQMDTISSNIANANTTRNARGEKEVYKKKLFHGLYIQNYGEYSSGAHPIDFELWKLQCMKVLCSMRGKYAFLDGCVLLQNGWVANPEFRDHVVWLKETLDWFCGTTTLR